MRSLIAKRGRVLAAACGMVEEGQRDGRGSDRLGRASEVVLSIQVGGSAEAHPLSTYYVVI